MERPRPGHGARRESWLTHTSPSQTSPRSGGSSSPSRLSSVDLPQPEGPATATNSPAPTSPPPPATTGTGPPSGPRNVLLRPTARTRIGATSGSAPDGLGGRQPPDAQGGGGRGAARRGGGGGRRGTSGGVAEVAARPPRMAEKTRAKSRSRGENRKSCWPSL